MFTGTIEAGCVCAEKMEDGYSSPDHPSNAKKREARLRNAAGRKNRWLSLAGWKVSPRGNPHISKDGYHIVIFKAGIGYKFRIKHNGIAEEFVSRRLYPTSDDARLHSFDAMTRLEELRVEAIELARPK